MKILLAITLFVFSAFSFAGMTTVTAVYELNNAKLEQVDTNSFVVVFKKCDDCTIERIPLATDAIITYQNKTLTQQAYLLNHSKFRFMDVYHHLANNLIIEIKAF